MHCVSWPLTKRRQDTWVVDAAEMLSAHFNLGVYWTTSMERTSA
jgi:hypothetical protein